MGTRSPLTKMKTLVLLLCGLAAASASIEWENFKSKFGKLYSNSADEAFRKSVFEDKLKYIEEHNKLYAKGEKTYWLKINNNSDLTHDELMVRMMGSPRTISPSEMAPPSAPTSHVKNEIDWRAYGAVGPVRDQGQCGSCWAFATVASLEGIDFLKTGVLKDLSEQNLVDCSGSYGNQGCGGGWPYQAMAYIRDYGIEGEYTYPYKAIDDYCSYSLSEIVSVDTGYVQTPAGDETALEQAVYYVGPVSVCIDASQPSFGSYGGGVYYEPYCSSYTANHAVTVVGYGVDSGYEYWIVRNSWGSWWGESGYIRMAKNQGNNCAIASFVAYPTV